MSSGSVDALSEITVARTSDGVLHAVYSQDVGSSDEYEHAAISTSGSVLSRSKPVGTWGALIHNPKLMRSTTGGLRLVFSGLQDTNSANFYSHGYAYDTIGDISGASWTLQPRALTKFGYAYSGYGVGATTLSNGTPSPRLAQQRHLLPRRHDRHHRPEHGDQLRGRRHASAGLGNYYFTPSW